MARGLQNNNPGNIRSSSELFQGEIRPSSDPEFKQFEKISWGYRAIFRILSTYINGYNLNTIEKIIYRWAPPSENDTEGYISFVEQKTGINRNAIISFEPHALTKIVAAISHMENGIEAVMDRVIEGWNLQSDVKKKTIILSAVTGALVLIGVIVILNIVRK